MDASDVTDVQRQAAKGIVFGSMYGMSVNSLAASIHRELQETQEIRDKFFARFPNASKWLDKTVYDAKTTLRTTSMLGRHRNLFGYLTNNRPALGAMDRRAQNSPIQGLASDIGIIAADIYIDSLLDCYKKLGYEPDLPVAPNAMVHDSIKGEAPIKYYLLSLHLLEYSMTTGAKKYLESKGLFVNVGFDIEIELGASWGLKNKWDFSSKNLEECVLKALEYHNEIHGTKYGIKTANQMFRQYKEQCKQLNLHKRFPLNDKPY
jgi:DNA polymerase I-like protein with 3'-5' exonuclease and polymerase domains